MDAYSEEAHILTSCLHADRFSVSINASDPPCRDDPSGKLAKFASANNDADFCGTLGEW